MSRASTTASADSVSSLSVCDSTLQNGQARTLAPPADRTAIATDSELMYREIFHSTTHLPAILPAKAAAEHAALTYPAASALATSVRYAASAGKNPTSDANTTSPGISTNSSQSNCNQLNATPVRWTT